MQKWLITGAVVLTSVSFGTLVYSYERYYRGPGENALFGTWLDPNYADDPMYYEFRPDHTFSIVALFSGEKSSIVDGRWYAGGKNIYLRYPAELIGKRRPIIWHIVEISRDEFSIRVWRHGRVIRYRRVNLDSPPASNPMSGFRYGGEGIDAFVRS